MLAEILQLGLLSTVHLPGVTPDDHKLYIVVLSNVNFGAHWK